jgi:hypothetical protein
MRTGPPSDAALGFRVHSGWAALVAVAGSVREPEVLLRRGIEFADFENHATVQPYHAAAEMTLPKAEKFLARLAEEARELAQKPIRQAIEELKPRRVACAAMTLSSGRPTGSLEATLASHPAIHTAEGEFFRSVVRSACEDCGLQCHGVKEKELAPHIAPIADLRKLLGPPWQRDQKLAALAAWLVLADKPKR